MVWECLSPTTKYTWFLHIQRHGKSKWYQVREVMDLHVLDFTPQFIQRDHVFCCINTPSHFEAIFISFSSLHVSSSCLFTLFILHDLLPIIVHPPHPLHLFCPWKTSLFILQIVPCHLLSKLKLTNGARVQVPGVDSHNGFIQWRYERAWPVWTVPIGWARDRQGTISRHLEIWQPVQCWIVSYHHSLLFYEFRN